MLLLPITSGLEIAQPYLLKKAIDEHIARRPAAGARSPGRLLFFALIGQYGASFGQTYLHPAGRPARHERPAPAPDQHVLSLASSFFDRTPIGRLMTRITSDVEALNEMFASGLVSLLGDVIRLSAILIAIFGIDWKLALFSMGSAPILFAIAAVFRRYVRDAFREIRIKLARDERVPAGAHLGHEGGAGVRARGARRRRGSTRSTSDYRDANSARSPADAALYALVEALASIAVAGLVWHGGARIAGGTLTFGVLVAFIEYLSKFFEPDPRPVGEVHDHAAAMAAAERVFGLLDTARARRAGARRAAGGGRRSPSPEAARRGRDRRRHLRLPRRRAGAEPGVAVDRAAGETLAVVGATGSGKSTLIKLLPRLYEQWSGAIRLGGVDVRDMDRRALRRRIVVVSRTSSCSPARSRDNIGASRPEPSRERHPGSGAAGRAPTA